MTGKLIAVEGINRIGKTAAIAAAVQTLQEKGFIVDVDHELSAGVGRTLRGILQHGTQLNPHVVAMLFVSARLDSYRRNTSRLEAGTSIVYDRFLWSSLAYHSALCDPIWVASINARSPAADFNIVLDADPNALRHRANRSKIASRYANDLALQRVIRQNYLDLVMEYPDKAALVDAVQPVPQVAETIAQIVQQVLE